MEPKASWSSITDYETTYATHEDKHLQCSEDEKF